MVFLRECLKSSQDLLKFQLKYQNESEVVVETNQRQREAERQIDRFKYAFDIYESEKIHVRKVLRINNPTGYDDNDKVWDPLLGEIRLKS
jgi:hypothetical protein